MRWYAERPGRVARQLVADLIALLWAVLAVVAGTTVREGLNALRGPGDALVGAGGQVTDSFTEIAGTVSGLPFVGGDLSRALDPAVGAGTRLADAGQEFGDTVATVADWAGVLIPLLLLLPVLLGWLPLRLRYARRAGAAVGARGVAPDLLAVRALARVPVARLTRIAPDPAAAWRSGGPEVVQRLAELELADLGLRAP
ncbi:hypothetical protein ACLFMI_23880 [Pseudonocardia nantongensis]|uniref:hypothetical protein n=1 Tax=Pseudonocardia nantongensis TaxID=1181885 RepID=UPI00397DE15D